MEHWLQLVASIIAGVPRKLHLGLAKEHIAPTSCSIAMHRILPSLFAVIMLASAIGHAIVPEVYAPLIPDVVSAQLANILSVVLEAGIGLLLLFPKTRHLGGLGFMALMIGFLPIHIWELFRENPMIGPMPFTIARVLVQLLLIYAGFRIYRVHTQLP